jgi:hypothetical protein
MSEKVTHNAICSKLVDEHGQSNLIRIALDERVPLSKSSVWCTCSKACKEPRVVTKISGGPLGIYYIIDPRLFERPAAQ